MYYFPVDIFLQKILSAREILLRSFYAEADLTPSSWCATEFPVSFPLQVLLITDNTEPRQDHSSSSPGKPEACCSGSLWPHDRSTHPSALHSQILASHRSYAQWLMLISLSHTTEVCIFTIADLAHANKQLYSFSHSGHSVICFLPCLARVRSPE